MQSSSWVIRPLRSILGALIRIACFIVRPEAFLCLCASLCFPLALLEPIFTVDPTFGDPLIDAAIEEVKPNALAPRTHSVLSGIAEVYMTRKGVGEFVVATVLLVFSVFFPAIKLALTWRLLLSSTGLEETSTKSEFGDQLRTARRLEMVGPWSMADVFVVSILVIAFKSIPAATFYIERGYYFFLVSVVMSLASIWVLQLRINQVIASQQVQ